MEKHSDQEKGEREPPEAAGSNDRSTAAASSMDAREEPTVAVGARYASMERKADRRHILDTLDHILMTGEALRENERAFQAWERKRKRRRLAKNAPATETDTAAAQGSDATQSDCQDGMRHSYHWDESQYGFGPPGRPCMKQMKQTDDDWDRQCSDGINPILFAASQLSKANIPLGSLEELDGIGSPDRHSNPPDFIPEKDVFRAILLHCWERAMSAASGVLTVDNSGNEGSDSVGSKESIDGESLGSIDRDRATDYYSRESAETKCRELGIDIVEKEDGTFQCLSCGIDFSSRMDHDKHFFGHGSCRGCCWRVIRNEQRKLIDGLLQSEVKLQMEGIAKLIALDRPASDGPGKSVYIMDWTKVIDKLEEQVVSASNATESESSSDDSSGGRPELMARKAWLETLQIDPEKPPVLMNQVCLDEARRRLTLRYAL